MPFYDDKGRELPTHTDGHNEVTAVEWVAPEDPALLDNYAQLRAERDWSWDQIADQIALQDEPLADWIRENGPKHEKTEAPAEQPAAAPEA